MDIHQLEIEKQFRLLGKICVTSMMRGRERVGLVCFALRIFKTPLKEVLLVERTDKA